MQTNDEIFVASTPDGAAVLHVPSGTMTTLNTTGAFVWEALKAGNAAEEIAAELAKRTGADLQAVEGDIALFVSALEAQCLLP